MLGFIVSVMLIALVPVHITNESIPEEIACFHIDKDLELFLAKTIDAKLKESYWEEEGNDVLYQNAAFERHFYEFHYLETLEYKREVCNVNEVR